MAASGTTKKSTINQLLGSGGTATLASATITGDLTVRTTGLLVTSTGVGIGISPTRNLSLFSSSSPVLQLCDSTSGTTLNDGLLITQAGVNTFIENAEIGAMNFRTSSVTRYSIDATGISTWSVGGTTAMTLNASGLGVGVSPGVGFDLQQTSPMARVTSTSTTGYSSLTLRNTAASGRQYGITIGGSGTGTNAGNLVITDDTASATRFVLDPSGNVGIGVATSAGKGCLQLVSGINFPATQVASSDANTLDDYEEGTWTIGLTFGGGNTGITTTLNTGRYTKVGRQVSVSGILSLSNKGSSTGIAEITGLPFTIANINEAYSVANVRFNGISFADVPICIGAINSAKILLQEITNAGAVTDITDADFTNTSSFIISLTYTV
jgi:hypothetical protein